MLTGKINFSSIAAKLIQKLLQRWYGVLIHVFGPLIGREDLSRKVLRWLGEFSARGTHVLLGYSAEDGGLDEIAKYASADHKKIQKLAEVDLRIIEGTDHNLTLHSAQKRYTEILEEFFMQRRRNDLNNS